MRREKLFIAFTLLTLLLIVSSVVSAVEVDTRTNSTYERNAVEDAINQGTYPGLEVLKVKINGDEVENGDEIRYSENRGNELSIRVELMTTEDMKDVEIMAFVFGDDHHQIADDSETFDVETGTIYKKNLKLTLPAIMDRDDYKLRLLVANRNSASKVYNYNLKVDAEKHLIEITDVVLSPANNAQAGRALLAMVRVRNLGKTDEDNLKVTVSIPALGISSSDYIDEIEADDSVSSEELYMLVPADAVAGQYSVEASVDYDEMTRSVDKITALNIVAATKKETEQKPSVTPSEEKTVIAIAYDSKDINVGESGVLYPITLYNKGSVAKSYSIDVSGVSDWGVASVSPSNVLNIDAGNSETVYLFVTANEDASVGKHDFVVTITSDTDSKAINLNANVVGNDDNNVSKFKRGLEIGLIILVVLLVILGLIVAFNKMKGDDDGENYY